MKVNREHLLKCLESIIPGTSTKSIVEQSNCAVFQDGFVSSFNDEIAVTAKSPVDIKAAVFIQPLVAILNKLEEKEIDVVLEEGQLRIKGKRRRGGVSCSSEIELPIDTVDQPKEWKKLPEKFIPYISIVRDCVSKDESQFLITCVHITPDHIEACDNNQAIRYKIDTGFSESTLIRGESVQYVCRKDIIEFSETKSWVHFRNKDGLCISCRRYQKDSNESEFPSLDEIFILEGNELSLPKEVKSAAEKANVFSKEDKNLNMIKVTLKDGKAFIRGESSEGWFSEFVTFDYKGEATAFFIPPSLLINIVDRKDACIFGSGKIGAEGEDYVYVSSVALPEDT